MLTTRHFTKLQEMGYPDGCHEWGPVQIDTEYSIERMKGRKARSYAAALMLFVAFMTGIWMWGIWG